jgi:superfamily I DNA/RNA helicase
MKERVRDLLVRKGLAYDDPWIGTFHSFAAWLLRREATRLGSHSGRPKQNLAIRRRDQLPLAAGNHFREKVNVICCQEFKSARVRYVTRNNVRK